MLARAVAAAESPGGPCRIEPLEARQLLAAGDPVISEFLAVNSSGEDWIEIHNPGQPVNLAGWRLTDDVNVLDKWVFPSTPLASGAYLVVTADDTQAPPVSGQPLHANFKLSSDGEYLALVKPDGTIAHEYAPVYPRQVSNVSYGLPSSSSNDVTLLASGAAGPAAQILIPSTSGQLAPDWNARGFDDSAWPITGQSGIGYDTLAGAGGYDPLVRTDVQAQMYGAGKNTSAFIRMPFEIDGANDLSALTLRIAFDDGFIAYINGTRVAARNEPASPDWDSASDGTVSKNSDFVTIDITQYRDALLPGENVLAIHGLNQSNTSSDFLILPELIGTRSELSEPGYMVTPTRLLPNVAGAQGVVADTEFSVDRGFYDAPFTVELDTDTSGAQVRYTLDGSLPTQTAGTLYTAPIPVNKTTTIRAVAYRPGFISSNVDAQTYIFLDNVVQQSGAGLAPYANWGHAGPDWEIDPDLVGPGAPYANTIRDDLLAVPTMHLSLPWADMFGSGGQGIYIQGSGIERRASVELINPDGTRGFHATSAVEIQGGTSDQRWKDDKLSMELTFKEPYGPTKLDYPLFGEGSADSFDRIILDGVLNWSWVHAQDGNQRANAKYLTDQLVADFQNKISGHGAPHGRAMHLYINNLYWGMYYVHEKPTETFAADYYGGDKETYDVIKHHTNRAPVNGTVANYQALLNLANQDLSSQSNYDALLEKLDIVDFIDYMIVNFYAGNNDWAHQNWYASYNTADPAAKWHYHSWDAEHTFISLSHNQTSRNDPAGPTRIHQQLKLNPGYRLLFADRVQKHFFNGGELSPAKALESFMFRVNEIDRAIVGESVRWGDNSSAVPYTRENWRNTINGLINNYFPNRTNTVLSQFRDGGLFPDTNAPLFDKFGGAFDSPTTLTITRPAGQAGTIYYTLDGTDPRLPGATAYSGPVAIGVSRQVKARILNGGEWSALVDATFLIGPAPSLRVTEIMYNPPPPTGLSAWLPDDFEFIEVQNTGNTTLNVSGYQFTKGVTFTFAQGTVLAPGARTVVVKNLAAFQSRYGTGVNVAGAFTGTLNNGGERLSLRSNLAHFIEEFTYDDNWHDHTDGAGWSLVAIDPSATDLALSTKDAWRPSTPSLGAPGAADPGVNPGSVLVNEAFVHPTDPATSWIELHNPTAADIDISGWFLSNARSDLTRLQLPAGTIVPAGGYRLLWQPEFAAAFSLSMSGQDVLLSGSDGAGNLGGYREDADFPTVDPSGAFSFGKHVKSTGGSDFARMTPTPAAANAYPDVGPVVITEIMYKPELGGDEFIEIRNVTTQPVDLSNWKFTSGVTFAFPAGTILAPGAHTLIVPIDPAAFRSKYSIPAGVPILGHYTGALNNAGEKLALSRPTGAPADPYVEIDRVSYNNKLPWPEAPSGTGPSLARTFASRYANDVVNWRAETASPGTPGVTNTGAPYAFFAPAFTYSGGMKLVAQFSENVSASANDLALLNRDTGAALTAGINFTYDPATFTATWALPADLADANYRATLLATGLLDGSNSQLDGDYSGSAGGNQVYEFFHLAGDINRDRMVNAADFQALSTHFGQSGRGWAGGDLNLDGFTNFADFQVLERSFGKVLAAPPAAFEQPAPAPAPMIAAATPPRTVPAPKPPAPKPAPRSPAPKSSPRPAPRMPGLAPPPRFAIQRIKPAARRMNELLA